MLDYYLNIIEDLYQAGKLLDSKKSIKSRMSLAITDNIIELITYNYIRNVSINSNVINKTSWDLNTFIDPYKSSKDDRKKAVKGSFEDKINYLEKVDKITKEKKDFISNIHFYKKLPYHRGIKYDDIITNLAWIYHDYACDLSIQLAPDYYDKLDKINLHENLKEDIEITNKASFTEIIKEIKNYKSRPEQKLKACLSESAINKLKEIWDSVDFIYEMLQNMSKEEIIVKVGVSIDQKMSIKRLKFWEQRAEMIKKEKQVNHALEKYNELIDDIKEFYYKIQEMEYSIDKIMQYYLDNEEDIN